MDCSFLGHRISTESKNPGNGVPLPDSNDERKIDRTTRKGWFFNILELRTQCIEILIFTKQKYFLCHKVKKGDLKPAPNSNFQFPLFFEGTREYPWRNKLA